jgi:class 3 adenylate cyclase/DNA-binding transcriptional MerR regulator
VSRLTAAELARQSGTTNDMVDRFAGRGIITPGDDGLFDPVDLHRVRIAVAMLDVGVTLDDMARLVEEGRYSFRFIGEVFPQAPPPLLDQTFEEMAVETGLPMEAIENLYANWSLAAPGPNQRIRADDAEMLHGRGELITRFGLDSEMIIAASRFFGENIRKMAESQVRFFRSMIIEGLRERGMSWAEVLEAVGPIAKGMRQGSEQLRATLYDRHLENYIFQQAIEIFEAALEEAGYGARRDRTPPAIAFLDMGGYTFLTQKAGDEAAAELAATLASLVQRATREYDGEPVKLLGDGVMFHFRRPHQAVACGLELVESAERQGLPPARMGADVGAVVFRDGDYFGQTVNVAARISDYARPGEVLVSQALVDEAAEAGFEFEAIGEIPLKGIREPVPLYSARNRNSSAPS